VCRSAQAVLPATGLVSAGFRFRAASIVRGRIVNHYGPLYFKWLTNGYLFDDSLIILQAIVALSLGPQKHLPAQSLDIQGPSTVSGTAFAFLLA
jgi:hypothetical protein